MCCIARCLFGYVASWVVFALNVGAAGLLLAGAFAPWLKVGDVYFTACASPQRAARLAQRQHAPRCASI